jgi:hypothetical protein
MTKETSPILTHVREAASKRILFLPHALAQMISLERMIAVEEVKAVIMNGSLVEDYPDDPRGHSCLLSGLGAAERPIHVVCAPKKDYLAIITAYLPSLEKWEEDWKTRK